MCFRLLSLLDSRGHAKKGTFKKMLGLVGWLRREKSCGSLTSVFDTGTHEKLEEENPLVEVVC